MKTKFLIATVLLASLAGCKKDPAIMPVSGEMTELSVSVPNLITKADGSADGTVACFQVFAFREDGTLENSSYGTGSTAQTLKLTKGQKTLSVVVNHEQITDISAYADIKSKVCDLSENNQAALLMYGEAVKTLSSSKESVSVEVSRLVAKVSIAKVTNAFSFEPYKSAKISISKVYLINAAGTRTIADGSNPSKWYNEKVQSTNSSVDKLLLDSKSVELVNGNSASLNYDFYSYPNSNSDKPTRLVVEVLIGEETWYYPITVSDLAANKKYTVEGLKITVLGTKDPDSEMTFDEGSISIKVKDWTTETVSEVVI